MSNVFKMETTKEKFIRYVNSVTGTNESKAEIMRRNYADARLKERVSLEKGLQFQEEELQVYELELKEHTERMGLNVSKIARLKLNYKRLLEALEDKFVALENKLINDRNQLYANGSCSIEITRRLVGIRKRSPFVPEVQTELANCRVAEEEVKILSQDAETQRIIDNIEKCKTIIENYKDALEEYQNEDLS